MQNKDFEAWLERQGYVVRPVTSDWEVARWKAGGTFVVYCNSRGSYSFSHVNAQRTWDAYHADPLTLSGEPAIPAVAPTAAPAAKPAKAPPPQVPDPASNITAEFRSVHNWSGADLTDQAGRWIATVHAEHDYESNPQFQANVRLLCAAPALLNLVQRAVEEGCETLRPDVEAVLKQICLE